MKFGILFDLTQLRLFFFFCEEKVLSLVASYIQWAMEHNRNTFSCNLLL